MGVIKAQPYRHKSINHKTLGKLALKYYGPFQVLQKIGEVAYKLNLPSNALIHPVFHMSCLKAKLEQQVIPIPTLLDITTEGIVNPEPVVVLQERSHSLRNRTITQVFVQWQGSNQDDATWENLYSLQQQFPHLVGKVL